MKDQYVADIGDYGKYSLLRTFAEAGERVGVNWYYTKDDAPGSGDGSLRRYLDETKPSAVYEKLRAIDPDVYRQMVRINDKGDRKSICDVETSDIIPQASFYNKRLKAAGSSVDRRAEREKWFRFSVPFLNDSDLIFLDPDNGLLESRDAGKRNAEKYVFPNEVKAYFDDGQGHKHNVVYYCHKGRRKPQEWLKYKMCMMNLLPEARPIILTYHRGTQRSYVFLIHEESYKKYRSIIRDFLEKWDGHFTEEYVDFSRAYEFSVKWYDAFSKWDGTGKLFDETAFSQDASACGFYMDCGNMFAKVFPKYVYGTTDIRSMLDENKDIDLQLIGSELYSQWRYFNHWALTGPSEKDIQWFLDMLDYMKKESELWMI